jgi:hypothetical protein
MQLMMTSTDGVSDQLTSQPARPHGPLLYDVLRTSNYHVKGSDHRK